MPISLSHRLTIATAYSMAIAPHVAVADSRNGSNIRTEKDTKKKMLTLGFASYDFNNHPTAHLLEAIFHVIRSLRSQSHCRCQAVRNDEESYNRNDNCNINIKGNGTVSDLFLIPLLAQSQCVTRGIFRSVEIIAYSFGKHDNSTYRKRFEEVFQRYGLLTLNLAITITTSKKTEAVSFI
jgi:hypothetical protein